MSASKVVKKVGNVVTITIYAFLIVLLMMALSAKISGKEFQINGYQIKTVLSGSMEPEMKTGSIIAIRTKENPFNYQKGDVITYHSIDNANMLITHRIVDVIDTGTNKLYVTKGDNNDGNDSEPIPARNVIGIYQGFTIPYVGYALTFFYTKLGKIVFLILPGLMCLTWAIITALKTIKHMKEEVDSPSH